MPSLLTPSTLLTLACVLSLASGPLPAQQFSRHGPPPALLELYTSEGCNSCPPADRWLSALQNDDGLWRDYIPLAFHVDYWDGLGWRDPWAQAAFSSRQRDYAARNRASAVYTPGFFHNGREWRDWFRNRPSAPPPRGGEAGPALELSIDDQLGTLTLGSNTAIAGVGLLGHIALLRFDVYSAVQAGENRGHRLRHDFLVQELITVPLARPGAQEQWSAPFELEQACPAQERCAIAAWVTRERGGAPLQALGGWLAGGLASEDLHRK